MSDKPENPPAFPQKGYDFTEIPPLPGMTLRDYFAGQVLPKLVRDGEGCFPTPKLVAMKAYEVADAMLEERKEKA